MKYKIHVSGYIEETQQLLVSFSSDETSREAADYQSLAFDIIPYGDVSIEEVLKQIAKQAPGICEDIKVQETYTDNSVKSHGFRNLVGKSYTYDLLVQDDNSPDPALNELSMVRDQIDAEVI